MTQQHLDEEVGLHRIDGIPEYICLHRIGGCFLAGILVESSLIVEQLGPHLHGCLHGGEHGGELIADGEREAQRTVDTFLDMPTGTRLFEEDADAAVHIRIGGTFSIIKIIISFLGEIQRSYPVEMLRVIGRDLSGQLLVAFRGIAVHPRRLSGLEEEGSVGAHLVMIGQDVRLPVVEDHEPVLALIMLRRQPVAVEVEPIVVETSAGPGLAELAVVRIAHARYALVAVHPGGKPL